MNITCSTNQYTCDLEDQAEICLLAVVPIKILDHGCQISSVTEFVDLKKKHLKWEGNMSGTKQK